MAELRTPDRLTTLDDLKRAIAAMPTHPGSLIPGQDTQHWLDAWSAYNRSLADAWRTAFQWRDKDGWPRLSEYVNGMRLIREKLR